MKRPERFDGSARPPAREPSRASGSKPARAERPARADRAAPERRSRERVAAPRLAAPARQRVDGAARPRVARAEFAASERRRKREERAERRRFTRSARRRRISVISGFVVVALLVGILVTAVFSPILALRHVTVDGTARLDAATLEDAVDGQLGTPLALLDESRIRSELGEFSLIRSYVTELVPPDTLLIHVVERSPIGVIQGADGFRLVDPAGVVIETALVQPPGFPLMQLASGDDTSDPGFRSMAEVLLALPQTVLAQVSTISAQTRDDVTLTLTGSSQRVIWGTAEGSVEKAAVLSSLIALHQGDGAGEYDVSAPGIGVFRAD